MNSYNILKVQLTKTQIEYIQVCIKHNQPIKLLLSVNQMVLKPKDDIDDVIQLPLTSLQKKLLEFHKDAKSPISLEFHAHQVCQMAKINFNQIIECDMTIHMKKRTIRK